MKKYLFLLLATAISFAQNPTAFPNGVRTNSIQKYPASTGVGINTTNPQAALDVVSTASGVLDPRVTESQRDAMTVGANQNGMRVFVTDGTSPGFYYYDHPSTSWKSLGGGRFIPMEGTPENDPVTGDIATESIYPLKSEQSTFMVGTAINAELEEGFGGGRFVAKKTGTVASAGIYAVDDTGADFVYLKAFVDKTNPANSALTLEAPNTGRGISSENDFTANITDLDYTQKKYVDEAIAAAGGGGTLQTVTDAGATTTNTITIADGAVIIVRDAEGNYATGINQDQIEALNNITGSGTVLKNNGTIEFRNGESQQHISSLATAERFNSYPDSDGTVVVSASVNGGTKVFADTEGNIDLTIAGGSGIESVTGNIVDSTDPDNPIITGVASVTGTAVTGTSTNPIIDKPVVTLGQTQSGMGYSVYTDTDPTGITLLPALSTPNVRDGLMSGTDKVSFDAAKAVNGYIVSNGSGTFSQGTITNAGTSGNATFSAGNFNIPRYDTYADTKVADNLTASTTVAPSKTAVNTALALKANLASPTFTGTPNAPTAAIGTNTDQLATTAFVQQERTPVFSDVQTYATSGAGAQIISSQVIPAGRATKGFDLNAMFVRTGAGAGNVTLRCYVNNSNTLTGAQQIAQAIMGASTRWAGISRMCPIEGSTMTVYTPTVSAPTDMITASGDPGTPTVNTANAIWIIWEATVANGADVVTQKLNKINRY